MARRKRSPTYPFRSCYEEDISKNIKGKWKYEAYSYEYTEPVRKNRARCSECGSTSLVRQGWYTPDFFLESGVIVEAKGRFTAADRRKMKAVKDTVPELSDKIVMMFMTDNKLNKRAKMRYSDWCEENGFDYVIGTVPKEEWYE